MRRFWQDHGLTVVTFGLFFLFWAAMAVAGYFDYNAQQQDLQQPPIRSFLAYLGTGHFWEATFENWESEYLQMGLFVLLTAYFFQKGSAAAKTRGKKGKEQRGEEKEEQTGKTESEEGGEPQESGEKAPWPIRRGGFIRTLYENSLSIALLGFFLVCIILHAISAASEYNHEQILMAKSPVSFWKFLAQPDLWFQSMQNWQSEFLAVGSMVVLTIFLRQKGSAESKRVGASDTETGGG